MKKSLDKKLCEKYPKIFAERNLPMTQTCMCWGFPEDGWYNIIDTLCSVIQRRIDYANTRADAIEKHNLAVTEGRFEDLDEFFRKDPKLREVPARIPQVVAEQVKEKFAGLRFYYKGGDETIHHYVDFAEAMSLHTCELCGKPGEVYYDGWHRTLCPTHAKKLGRSKANSTKQQQKH